MHRVQAGPAGGFLGLLVLLAGLDATVGLATQGWVGGLVCASLLWTLLDRAVARRVAGGAPSPGLGPADGITLLRAELACGVAALAITAAVRAGGHATVAAMVGITVVALLLDGVDGRVARRTATVSAFGARFDMEVDALLILVLSAYVAHGLGWWVLLIGAARYLFLAAAQALPWLRGTAPPRPWCKVVAVLQGVVLTVAASGAVPSGWVRAALFVALLLLAESFGHEARDLWRARVTVRTVEDLGVLEPAARG